MLTKKGNILTLKDVQDLIEHIKTVDRTDSFYAYTYVYNLINSLYFPAPPVKIKKGQKFIRGRVHKNNELYFEKVSDLSYRKDINKILTFGRANEPHQSIFYCSDNQVTALNETFTVAREDKNIEYEEITWSVWELTKDIELIYVIGNPDKPTPNTMVNESTQIFLKKLKQFKYEEQTILFHKFISDQFGIRANGYSSLYKISCAFANYIYNHIWSDSESEEQKISAGIIYSSSICPEEGMNIALKTDFVDDTLKIIGAQKARMERIGKTHRYEEKETHVARSISITENKIYW